jgi:hypothetical protein
MAVIDYCPVNINLDVLNKKQGKIMFWGIDEEIRQVKLDIRNLKIILGLGLI